MIANGVCLKLIDTWKTLRSDVELEVRAALKENDYRTITKYLHDHQCTEQPQQKEEKEHTTPRLVKGEDVSFTDKFATIGTEQVRQRTFHAPQKTTELIKKERLQTVDVLVYQRAYDVRFSLGLETPVSTSVVFPQNVHLQREVKRTSFLSNDGIRIDLSLIHKADFHKGERTTQYEIEVECLPVLMTKPREVVLARLQYWTLFWLECLGKDVQTIIIPCDAGLLTRASSKIITSAVDVLWILKVRQETENQTTATTTTTQQHK